MVYQEVIIASREVKIRSERVKMHKVLIKLLTKEVLSIPALKGGGGGEENIRYQSEKTAGAETLNGSVSGPSREPQERQNCWSGPLVSESSGVLSQRGNPLLLGRSL